MIVPAIEYRVVFGNIRRTHTTVSIIVENEIELEIAIKEYQQFLRRGFVCMEIDKFEIIGVIANPYLYVAR